MEWKAINKEGRHVGLDFYDLLIEGLNTQIPTAFDLLHIEAFVVMKFSVQGQARVEFPQEDWRDSLPGIVGKRGK